MSKYERESEKKVFESKLRAHKNSIYVATSWYATVTFSGIPLQKKKKNKMKVSHCTVT